MTAASRSFCALWLALFAIAACGGDDVGTEGKLVGGPCAFSSECDESGGSLCLLEESFPGGTCAVRCANQDQCPDGSRCVNKNTGICLLSCGGADDCRAGYACEILDDQEGGGASTVCIAPPNQ
jgi:hypothetical protein